MPATAGVHLVQLVQAVLDAAGMIYAAGQGGWSTWSGGGRDALQEAEGRAACRPLPACTWCSSCRPCSLRRPVRSAPLARVVLVDLVEGGRDAVEEARGPSCMPAAAGVHLVQLVQAVLDAAAVVICAAGQGGWSTWSRAVMKGAKRADG